MPPGTLSLSCKICGAVITIPWGKPVTASNTQCPFGCYEIYPGVLSWNARRNKMRVLRTEAVGLLKKYRTYDKLVAACKAIESGDRIDVSLTIPRDATPTQTKPSRKLKQKVNS